LGAQLLNGGAGFGDVLRNGLPRQQRGIGRSLRHDAQKGRQKPAGYKFQTHLINLRFNFSIILLGQNRTFDSDLREPRCPANLRRRHDENLPSTTSR
jgi:hypothetical protein